MRFGFLCFVTLLISATGAGAQTSAGNSAAFRPGTETAAQAALRRAGEAKVAAKLGDQAARGTVKFIYAVDANPAVQAATMIGGGGAGNLRRLGVAMAEADKAIKAINAAEKLRKATLAAKAAQAARLAPVALKPAEAAPLLSTARSPVLEAQALRGVASVADRVCKGAGCPGTKIFQATTASQRGRTAVGVATGFCPECGSQITGVATRVGRTSLTRVSAVLPAGTAMSNQVALPAAASKAAGKLLEDATRKAKYTGIGRSALRSFVGGGK